VQKFSNADCPDISIVIWAQFSLEMCAAAESCKKNTKTPFWGFKIIQGYGCWHLTPLKSSSLVLVMISSVSAIVFTLDEPIVVKHF